MKTISRIFVILLAAMLVVGATWAVGQSSTSAGDATAVVRGDRAELAGAEGRPARSADREGGDHHAAQFLSVESWLSFSKTLVPLVLIITLVALPTSLWKRRRRAHHHDRVKV